MEKNIKKGFSALAKKLPMSAKKVRPLADNVRGLRSDVAMGMLKVVPNKSAHLLQKVIQSATANAMHMDKTLDETQLYVKTIMIDVGPSGSRIWPRARGKADFLIKRTCHIFVEVDTVKDGE